MPGISLLMSSIYQKLSSRKSSGKKNFAILLDPDKTDLSRIPEICSLAMESCTDFILVGGSLLVSDQLDELVKTIKVECPIPVILFPGSPGQLTPEADALLYLSLISGRNPELLIGHHVLSAPAVRKSGLEIMSTGYMVVDGGAPTTVSYISNALPIPRDKKDIAVCTAMAGEMLGMKLLYLDAGSGARQPVTEAMIHAVSIHTQIPLIVGGGIRTPEQARAAASAGADMVVVGNALEKDMSLLKSLSEAVHQTADLKSSVTN